MARKNSIYFFIIICFTEKFYYKIMRKIMLWALS